MDPALIVIVVGELARLKSEPVPVRLTICGLPCALSLTERIPLRVPEAVGVNITLMLQLEPDAKDAGQLLVWLKSPVIWMPLMVSGAFPLLFSVAV